MRYRYLLPALALVAACDGTAVPTAVPTAAPVATSGRDLLADGHAAPRTEGNLTTPDGVRLFYTVVGTGPDTVVALHGGPGFAMGTMIGDWGFLAAGRTVVYYDQRGGGRSQLVDAAQLTAAHMVADLEAVRSHFGIERLKLVGHSWGAVLAGLYALEHPGRVDRMVLVTPAPVNAAFAAEFEANRNARLTPEEHQAIDALIPAMLFGPDPVGSCEALLGTLLRAYMADPANLAKHRGGWCDVPEDAARAWLFTNMAVMASLGDWDLRAALGGLSVPTLVVHGAADIVPLASSQGWAGIPRAEFRILQGTGHFPWLEDAPGFFTPVNAFLRRADPSLG